jgi:hypothetical protein
MTESTLEKLLGRPLTQIEKDNQYLKIAIAQLESLVCMNLTIDTEDRVFDVREGYQTVFTDLFTTINSITGITDYEVRQWDRRNADWYNSVIIDTQESEVTINADWGICSPELQQLIVKMFKMLTSSKRLVKTKEIEDYRVTYNDNTEYQQFLADNAQIINKYSLCTIGQIRSGDVCIR